MFPDNIDDSSQEFICKASEQNLSFDDSNLIDLHKIYGNKWKKISTYFSGCDDSFVKNHFYSLLRRSLRKVNSYIKGQKKAQNLKIKALKLNFVFKLTNLAQSQRTGISTKNNYTKLLYEFLQFRNFPKQQIASPNNIDEGVQCQKIEKLIIQLKQIQHFFVEHNLNKKGKSKKKCPKKLQLKKELIQKSLNRYKDDYQMKDCDSLTYYQTSPILSHMSTNAQLYQPQKSFKNSKLSYQNRYCEPKIQQQGNFNFLNLPRKLQYYQMQFFDLQEQDNLGADQMFSSKDQFDPCLFK